LLQSPLGQRNCTDVYLNKPNINEEIVNQAFICTPQISGHTVEAKVQAMQQVSQQIHHYLNLPLLTTAQSINAQTPALSQFLAHYDPRTETFALKK